MVLEVSIDRSTEPAFVAELTDLVNQVYADAEKGLWVPGTRRTDEAEVAAVLEAGEFAVARLDAALVGAVRVQRLPGGEGEFGMLVASPAHRGAGIGRELVRFAEAWARGRGARTMQLELLVPRDWTHPVKEFLREWYERLGYRAIRRDQFEQAHPTLAPRLATPCDFVVYHKPI
ncbi:GNAT family N-acetyltransferase [Asanoa siamensis]|uniref:GNAT family N-acetyltransferase n=1 Tax=Asanoa siamensis TaxID=926357 RepID=A0ABQ4CH19_9ACTN|nr:GNAT family N-acetyltransferase [Asanoa siamensis]GIF70573.1 GNAT family N-acetyltransferase [Asanoa siamensis]